MKRRLIDTNDGSKTIYIEELDETYHSFHGAIQEANHVFIKKHYEITFFRIKLFYLYTFLYFW